MNDIIKKIEGAINDQIVQIIQERLKDLSDRINSQSENIEIKMNGDDITLSVPDSYPHDLRDEIFSRF